MQKRNKKPKAKPARRQKTPARARRGKAATQDVLGDVATPYRPPRKWQREFKRLMELRGHITNHKGNLVSDARQEQPAFSLHMADAGTDHFDRDFALSMISSEQNALYEIEQALNRIKDGTYGICEATGKPIEPKRLEAIPWARFSAQAERQLEKDGAVQGTQLGRRQTVPRLSTLEERAEQEEG
jgi:DnaK suppressor protein